MLFDAIWHLVWVDLDFHITKLAEGCLGCPAWRSWGAHSDLIHRALDQREVNEPGDSMGLSSNHLATQ